MSRLDGEGIRYVINEVTRKHGGNLYVPVLRTIEGAIATIADLPPFQNASEAVGAYFYSDKPLVDALERAIMANAVHF